MTKEATDKSPTIRRKRGVQARSFSTKQNLIAAAIDCLWERGYDRCSIAEITKKAAVTHGAHLHHFGTREELIAAAVDALFQRLVTEYEVRFSSLPTEMPARAAAALDHFREMAHGQLFGVVTELLNAARTNPEMAVQMRGYSVSQRALQQQMYVKIFGEKAVADPDIYFWLDTTFAVYLRGLSLLQVTRTPQQIDQLWAGWKEMAVQFLTTRLTQIQSGQS